MVMEDQEGRFLLAGEKDAFKEKACNLFSALNSIQYSPAQDADSFLKSDPLKGRERFGGACEGNARQKKRSAASGQMLQEVSSTMSGLMPPPRAPAFKKKRGLPIPGHVKNPSKYTKYSLDDVPDQQMTQKSNTAAALAFLREIDAKRKGKTEDETSEEKRPIFKKPAHKTAHSAAGGDECSSNKSVGSDEASGSQKKAKLNHKSKKGKEIKLSHLEYEDE